MISVRFQGKPFNITVIQVYAPTSNAEEAEVEQFYEDLQDLLELTPKKDVLFIRGDWNAKVGSQETPGITGKFGLGIQNEAGQRLIDFYQENYHEIKRRLLLGRKVMTNLDSIFKSRDITLPTKVHLVKVFPVVMYGCESWTIKKAEHQRIDAFELWCWIRLLRVPWTARKSNQPILKEISPGCLLAGLIFFLILFYF